LKTGQTQDNEKFIFQVDAVGKQGQIIPTITKCVNNNLSSFFVFSRKNPIMMRSPAAEALSGDLPLQIVMSFFYPLLNHQISL